MMKFIYFLSIAAILFSCGPSSGKKKNDKKDLIEQAIDAYNDSLYTDALNYIDKYLQKADSTEAYPYELKGDIYLAMQDTAKAELFYNKSYNNEPGTAIGQKLFSLFYGIDIDKTCFYAKKLVDQFPADFDALNNYGLCQWESGDTLGAMKTYESILKSDKYYDLANFNLAYLYYEQENFHEALPYFTRISREYFEFDRAYYYGSICFLKLGDTANATKFLKQVIEFNDDYEDAHNVLGDIYLDKGKYMDAVFHYQRTVELDPEYSYYHHNLSIAYSYLDDTLKSIREMQKAYDLDSSQTYYGFQLGRTLYEFGYYDKAIKHFTFLSQNNSKWGEPLNGIGNCYLAKKNQDKAIEYYKKAIAAETDYAAPFYNLATIYLDQKKNAEAKNYIKKALKIEPENSEYLEILKKIK